MKPRLESHREFTGAPAETVSRATIVAVVAGVAVGGLVAVIGLFARQPYWAVAGLALCAIAWMRRSWLLRRSESPDALARVWDGAPAPDNRTAEELMSLLEQWEAMESKRGSPDFDPWALQALRNDIRRVVESDPGLEALFTRLREAA